MNKSQMSESSQIYFAARSNNIRVITNLLVAIFFIASVPILLDPVEVFINNRIPLAMPFNDYIAVFQWSAETLQLFTKMAFSLLTCLIIAFPFGILLSTRHSNFALICAMLAGIHLGVIKLIELSPATKTNGAGLVVDLIVFVFFLGLSIILGGYFRRQILKICSKK